MKAAAIMTTPVITVTSSTHVKQAARLLLKHQISAVPVVDEGRLVGVLTEADLVRLELADDPRDVLRRAFALDGDDALVPVTVAEVMSPDVIAMSPEADSAQIGRLMRERQVKCIPIVQDDRVLGVVSRRDLLAALVRNDADIRAELNSLLLSEPETYGGWSVDVHNGGVTLVGPPEPFRRRLAGIVAHTVPGVLGVHFAQIGSTQPPVPVGRDGELPIP